MSNQKLNYRKILTSERLPIEGLYYTDQGQLNFNYHHTGSDVWSEQYTSDIIHPDWWLEEIPNREEELADLLQDAIDLIDAMPWYSKLQEKRANFSMNAQNLIWEIKNNAPKLLHDEK